MRARRYVLGMLVGLILAQCGWSGTLQVAAPEIHVLIAAIGESGCDFYRNGSWYDARAAAAHLQHKYDLLAAANRIDTAEDFIERAATQSSLSGRAYLVRCGGNSVSSHRWLREELSCYRTNGSANGPVNGPVNGRSDTQCHHADAARRAADEA